MNWLDASIGWFSPQTAVKRIAARRALEIHERAYEAARLDHRTMGWHTSGASANAEVSSGEERVRNRSRDLIRNNGYALQIVETIADHVVGTGIVTAPIGLKGRNLRAVRDLWGRFVEECDFDNDQDLHGLCWGLEKGKCESGSAIIRFRRQAFDGKTKSAPLKLQVMEPDFIDLAKTDTVGQDGWIDRGIEYDGQGRRVAFWLLPAHPGDVASWRAKSMLSERVPAEELVYHFDKLRPGQDRGMPVLAPAIITLQDFKGYMAAELVRKRVAATQVGFITTTEDNILIGEKPSEKPKYGPQVQKFEPGMFTRLLQGEDITFNTPPSDSGVEAMAEQYLREAAMAAGVMYEQATGNFSRINYSSFRAGGHGFRRRTERRQWNFVHRASRMIAMRFTEAARAAHVLPAEPGGWRHTPPGFISVDPNKDADADLKNLRMGKVTLSELVEERGYDYLEHLQRYAADLDAAEGAIGAGVMFDGDPRKVLNQAKPADEKAKATNDEEAAATAAA
jgi:lambda family phage portal protein